MPALAAHDREVLQELSTRWISLAHPGQIPPEDVPWFLYLMRSGRGGGKTRAGSEWTHERVRRGARSIALIGETKADVRDIMVELGPSSLLKTARPHEWPSYEPSKRRVTWPCGAVALGFSGDEPNQLRGYAFDSAWVDELAKFRYPQDTWDGLMFCMRENPTPTIDPRVFITTTPRPIKIIRDLVKRPDTIDVRFSFTQNIDNLSPEFVKRIREMYEGTRLGRQELEGEILDDNPLSLWKRDVIENLRVREAPPRLVRIVVGVDPAVSGSEESDETGIVAAGLAADGAFYILADRSLRGSPNEWAHAVSKVYSDTRADRVIGEVNNGGDLVEVNLRTVDRQISFKAVHATRGKVIRAEPIAALYEQGKVHHVGTFPQLEDEMVEWVPGNKSPSRMDALVWALTELAEKAPITGSRFPIAAGKRTW